MPHEITPAAEALTRARLDGLAVDLYRLRDQLIAGEHGVGTKLLSIHPDHLSSARNLLHYISLRQYDIRPLQDRLSQVGLSSLGGVEPHVMIALERTLAMLALARQAGMPDVSDGPTPLGFRQGQDQVNINSDRLLGPIGPNRKVRIMVTMPHEASENPTLVSNLMASGMTIARINCAHDDASVWEAMVGNIHKARESLGLSCRICMDLAGPKIRTESVVELSGEHKLERGQWILLLKPNQLGETILPPADWLQMKRAEPFRQENEQYAGSGTQSEEQAQASVPPMHHVSNPPDGWAALVTCSVEAVFRDVRAGEPIWFDDGTIGGTIEQAHSTGLAIRIVQAPPGGRKLKAEKGINLPATQFNLPAMTTKDREDLSFVVKHADLVAMSFVNREDDVNLLLQALEEESARSIGVVLKIETNAGFRNLPDLLLKVMTRRDVGVMIARGDLAVESGFVRLAEVQEEILRIAEAAHVPTIWATQVLENLAKTGLPSRAEVTDAAMGVRAEAVMLNKGKYILEAVEALENILLSMQPHQTKKRSWLPKLKPA